VHTRCDRSNVNVLNEPGHMLVRLDVDRAQPRGVFFVENGAVMDRSTALPSTALDTGKGSAL